MGEHTETKDTGSREKGHGSETRRLPNQIMVRCDDALLTALQEDAEANGRTVAQSVRFHLKAVLSGSGGVGSPGVTDG